MPTSKDELWRYVDLEVDLAGSSIVDGPGTPMDTDDALAGALGEVAGEVHVVDGVAVSESGSDGAVFTSLAKAFSDHGDLVRPVYGTGIPVDTDKFTAAHHAFANDGAFLHVPSGAAIAAPFYLDVQAVTPDSVSMPRASVVVSDNAEASLVINYRSPHEAALIVVPHLEISLGANARLNLAVVQNFGYATTAIGQARVAVGRDATLHMGEIGLGGDLGRLHLIIDLVGRGASAKVMGAYFGEEDQTLDYRYFMHHAGTNTNSEMFLKGAVEDRALSVFTGMIRIDEDAQKTDAFQTNRNLILSEGAAAQSVPNLEILANDVRCGHGSTMGPLDAEQRYYLMSRGLERPAADRLQVRGFFEEVLARMPVPGVAAPARKWINAKYVAAQEEGRV